MCLGHREPSGRRKCGRLQPSDLPLTNSFGADVFDVAVLGGGNAGLCAALSAAERGARVLVIESAPREFRGGNSRHTRNLRCMHDAPTEVLTGSYPEAAYLDGLMRVAGRK